jgi:Spy/CpxP family protein refolding chaperone
MNKIKLGILGFGIFAGSVAFAQEEKTELAKEQRMEQRMDKLAKELNLTEVQKAEITKLRENAKESRQKLKNDERLDEASKKSAMQALRQENKDKMTEILTAEQMEKLQAMKVDRQAMKMEKHPKSTMKETKQDVKMKEMKVEKTPVEK